MGISVLNKDSFQTLDGNTLPLELGLAIVEIKLGYQGRVQDLLWQEGNKLFSRYLSIPELRLNQSLASTLSGVFTDLKDAAQKALKTKRLAGLIWQDHESKQTYLIQIKALDKGKMLICILDATDALKTMNEKLYWNEILLNSISNNFPSAVYAKDSEARKILANQADCRNSGVDNVEEILGKTDFDLFPRHIAEQFYQDDLTVLRDGKSIVDREETLGTDNGDERWLRTSKIPMKDSSGKIVGLVGFGYDITLEKRLEQENIAVQNRIREQQQMVEEMILDLAEIPEKMNELITGIADMAKRTKMVSINAAIESARVGEHGRGFHIVAEEVGRLSDESSNATTEIRDAIEEVNTLVQRILQLWEEVKLD